MDKKLILDSLDVIGSASQIEARAIRAKMDEDGLPRDLSRFIDLIKLEIGCIEKEYYGA